MAAASADYSSALVETVVKYGNWIHPRLGEHINDTFDTPYTIPTISIAILLFTLWMHFSPPFAVIVRRFRPWCKLVVTVAMVYRFYSLIVLSKTSLLGIETDLLTMALNLFNFFVDTIKIYLDLVFHSQLSMKIFIFFRDCMGLIIFKCAIEYIQSCRRISYNEMKDASIQTLFSYAKYIPAVANKLEEETAKMEEDLEKSLKDSKREITKVLPMKGKGTGKLIADLRQRGEKEDKKWEAGYCSGAVYLGDREHTKLLNEAYAAFSLSNPLHPDIWPSVNQFEGEVCAMVATMVNGGNEEVCGCLTSGGTESITLAAKSHRSYYGFDRSINKPEIVSCVTAHAGIDKACDLLACRNIKVPFDPKTYKVDLNALEKAITADTIMLYASAPSFPQGTIDDVAAISKLAVKYDVGLHVDCCLGGFVLPFAKSKGYDVPEFDFSLAGVTSMSVDTHKYGYASKGTSVVLYKHKDLRRSQYFCFPEWTGGLYATPTIAGSRPGALSAACWASMMAMGQDGYEECVESIMDCTQNIAKDVAEIDGLKILGEVEAMIICFSSDEFNIYRVGDKMAKLGWSLNSLQRPACIHLCVTNRTVEHKEKFITDLKIVVAEIRKEGEVKASGNAAIYGMAGSMPVGPVNELLRTYTDIMLKP